MNKLMKGLVFGFLTAGLFLLTAINSRAGTITVNSNADNRACDGFVTYREAVLLANGGVQAVGMGRALTTGERNQVSGENFIAAPPPASRFLHSEPMATNRRPPLLFRKTSDGPKLTWKRRQPNDRSLEKEDLTRLPPVIQFHRIISCFFAAIRLKERQVLKEMKR